MSKYGVLILKDVVRGWTVAEYLKIIALLIVLGFCTGCGGDDAGDIQKGMAPQVAIYRGGIPVLPGSMVSVSWMGEVALDVGNVGTGRLEIRDITVTGGFELVTSRALTVEPGDVETVVVRHVGPDVRGGMAILTSRNLDGSRSFELALVAETPRSALRVEPRLVEFGEVLPGSTLRKSVTLLNLGTGAARVERVRMSGHPGFFLEIGGLSIGVDSVSSSEGIVFDPPLEIVEGGAVSGWFGYQAEEGEIAAGVVTFNDDVRVEGRANVKGPCVRAVPARMDWGGKPVGSRSELPVVLESCGDVGVHVDGARLAGDGGGAYMVAGVDPVDLQPGAGFEARVAYTPQAIAPRGADGMPVRDETKLLIDHDGADSPLVVELSGFGTDGQCPEAIIDIAEGDEVIPQTTLHFGSSRSAATNGGISRWEWSVIQPTGSLSQFFPSNTVASPTFDVNVAGTYIFRLKIIDNFGIQSCADAERTVIVTSDDAIHVELLWHTPGDPDETDTDSGFGFSSGSDVDLHMLHPRAFGRYFDYAFDCYWGNPLPEWGSFGPNDNPRLDRDDTDGVGPENLNVAIGESGVRYQVGAHYWNDWGYGYSLATIRVYVYGLLRDEWSDVKIKGGDMWASHWIDWPSGAVTRIAEEGGVPMIMAQYPF